MKVLNLLTSGSFGGIEVYCKEIGMIAEYENGFCFLFGEGEVYDMMEQQKLCVYSLCSYSKLSFKRLKRLYHIARQYNVIVVHHGDVYLQAYYLLLRRLLPNKKFVRTIHSCYEHYKYENYGKIKESICDWVEQRILKRSDLIFAVSAAVKKTYINNFKVDPSKIHIIYNGIGSDKLQEGGKASLKRHIPLEILYVGRLVKEKGVDIFLDAIASLKGSSAFNVKIVGDGVLRKQLEEQARQLGISEIVSFEGYQKDIGRYLEKCDIFVYPSLWEAFGISLVEAMAYGRICVANAVGGIPEIIMDGENGFLSDKPDKAGLSHALTRAVSLVESEKDAFMRHNARQTAERFSIQATCRELANQLENLKFDMRAEAHTGV